jgi:hypothetical protein
MHQRSRKAKRHNRDLDLGRLFRSSSGELLFTPVIASLRAMPIPMHQDSVPRTAGLAVLPTRLRNAGHCGADLGRLVAYCQVA